MSTISKTFLLEFIVLYRAQPAIWETSSELYRNKIEKNKSWKVLLKKYKEIEEDATIDTVKKKINSLRSSYRREVTKMRKSIKSGATVEDLYVSKLWYFDELCFLMPYTANLDDSTDTEATSNESKKRKHYETEHIKKKSADKNNVKAVERTVENLEQRRDNAAVFAEGWEMIFRSLTPEQQIYSKRIIDETLAQAQLGRLTYKSSLNLERQGRRVVNPPITDLTYSSQNSNRSTPSTDIDFQFSPNSTMKVEYE